MNNDDPGSRTGIATPAQDPTRTFGPGEVDVVVSCEAWSGPLPQAESLARRAARAALDAAGWGGPRALCVCLADDATLRDLNARYRGQDKPTNVLAFALSEAGGPETGQLGDVVLALETLEREAAEQGKTLADHFRHLVVHGCLHLIGYDHQDDAEAEAMEALEVAALAALGVGDPYSCERAGRDALGGAA